MGSDVDPLQLETRKKIYNYVLKSPGAHLRKIARDMNLNMGTVEYHLRLLEKDDLVSGKEEGRYRRYYAVGKVGSEDKKLLSILRQQVPRKVVLHLLEKQKATAGELAEVSGVTPGTLSFHLKKLQRAGAIDVEKRGRSRIVRLKDKKKIAKLLILYRESFTDSLVDSFVKTWQEFGLE